MDRRSKDVVVAENSTFNWLIAHSSFQTWTQTCSGLLWIRGHPGSGKSTLLKYAMATENHSQNIIASFFFNGHGSSLEKSLSGLYRSLLHQLLPFSPEKHGEITRIYNNRCETYGEHEKQWFWHEKELELWLKDLLISLSAHSTKIYVDAIDEGGKEAAAKIATYFERILTHTLKAGRTLKVCLTCRHYPIISGLANMEICVENENRDDIAVYARTEFSIGGLSKDKAQILGKAIIEKANGIFQWAIIVVPRMIDLCQIGTKLRKVQEVIKQLPEELNELYCQIIKTIPNSEQTDSLALIQWICLAISPLSLSEMRYALVVNKDTHYTAQSALEDDAAFIEGDEDMEKQVKHLSRGLAEVKKHHESNWIQFIHQSVYDYLVLSGLQMLTEQSAASLINQGHLRLVRSCIRYLEMDDLSLEREEASTPEMVRYRRTNQSRFTKKICHSYPLAEYATKAWVFHFKHTESSTHPKELLDTFGLILSTRPTLLQSWVFLSECVENTVHGLWVGRHPMLPYRPNNLFTDLHVMACHGLSKLMSHYFVVFSDNEADPCDSSGRTPLSYAAEHGHETVVHLLIDRKDVQRDLKDKQFERTALSYAAHDGHLKIVQLLSSRSDVKADPRDCLGMTPLALAAENGHMSVAQLLLERSDVTADSIDNSGKTPLSCAARRGHKEIVKVLLGRRDVYPDHADRDGQTPLSHAASLGHEEVVSILLNCNNVDADRPDRQGQSPISHAADWGSEKVIRLLIQCGRVQVDRKDKSWETPLFRAADRGHREAVQMLAECKDVNVNSRDKMDRTPLAMAAYKGHRDVVKLLIRLDGIEIDSKDIYGRTPLSRAATEEFGVAAGEVVQTLLQSTDADVNSADVDGITPLMQASRSRFAFAVRHLLGCKNIKTDTKDKNGKTALSWAAYDDNDQVTELLIARNDVRINSKDITGMTPLMQAAYRGQEAVTHRLLRCDGLEVNARDDMGQTALSWAAMYGHEAVVQLLLEHADTQADQRDADGRTPLSYAAEVGQAEIVRLLVQQKGVRTRLRDKSGKTPYSYAASGRYEAVMNILRASRY